MSSTAIPLETTLMGQLKEAIENFQKIRSSKSSPYPENVKKLIFEANELGVPLKKLADMLGSHPSTIYGWIKQMPKRINSPKRKNSSKQKTPIIPQEEKNKTIFPQRLEISLGIFKVVLCFQ